ncbi:MAG: 4a-hydroxytetrahydrobiopterin dehydratase [Holosporales bacterium]|jgi:4a-hydroxytetrahydrobiopterin dehydratase
MENSSWKTQGKALKKLFKFKNFEDAFAFMSAMAAVSKRLDHHPTWTNTYNRVDVLLTTHDSGGITDLDHQWATMADRIYQAIAEAY